MKFIVARTNAQRDRLDSFFESYTVELNAQKERVVLWRPKRFGMILGGAVLGFYLLATLFVTWWVRWMAPPLEVSYITMMNPVEWFEVPSQWRDYQKAHPNIRSAATDDKASTARQGRLAADNNGAGGDVYTVGTTIVSGQQQYGPVLTGFFNRYGGLEKLMNIRAIQAHGTVTMAETGDVIDFTLMKMPPYKMRFYMKNKAGGTSVTVLTDGSEGWKWMDASHPEKAIDINLDEIMPLMREEMFCNLAVELAHTARVMRELPHKQGADEAYDIVIANLPHDIRAIISIEPDTKRAARVDMYWDADGVPHSYSIFVREWMQVDGTDEPKRIEAFYDGKKNLDCVFDKITYNPGAIDSLFEKPGAVSDMPVKSPTEKKP